MSLPAAAAELEARAAALTAEIAAEWETMGAPATAPRSEVTAAAERRSKALGPRIAELGALALALVDESATAHRDGDHRTAAAIGEASDRITADVAQWAAKCDPADTAAHR